MSFLEEYCDKIISGEITSCRKVMSLCKRLKQEIKDGYKGWHFDEVAARRPIEFIEKFCKVPSGRLGAPLTLELYEKAWIESIFGFVDSDGFRRIREAFIMVGRKNGKTSLSAALELYMLIADGEGSPQIYNSATTLDQATLAFNAAYKMVKQSGEIGKHVYKKTGQLYCNLNFGYIMPLASNSSSLDGLDIHMGVLDEIHAMKDREIYDLLRQGTGSRQQPLILQITTNGFVRNQIFDSQYKYGEGWLKGEIDDDRFIAWVYELDDRAEWEDKNCYIKANPGLGTVKTWEYMDSQVNKAKQDSSFMPTLMTKDFNLPENASIAWLDYDEAVNKTMYYGGDTGLEFKDHGFKYGICGFDASDFVDLTCAQLLMMKPGDEHIYVRSMYWIPEDVIIADMDSGRKERDGAPYQQWIKRGLMRTVPGNKVDKRVLIDWLIEMRDTEDVYCFALGYDPWHMTEDYLISELESFVGKSRLNKVRQGAQTLSQPMRQLKAEYRKGIIVDNHHPINEWCRMNVMVRSDINMNIQPDKKNLDPRNRIDGFAAELDAYVTLLKYKEEYQNYI